MADDDKAKGVAKAPVVAVDRALAESEMRYRMLADNAADIIACFGPDGAFTFLSPSIRTILGYEPEELIGRSTRVIMHPDDYRASVAAYRARVAEGFAGEGFRFEYRAHRKDGRMVWLSGHPRAIFDPATGELTGFQDVVRDVTAAKANEAALAESEARYRMLADHATDVILKVDAEDTILYASPSVRRYGYEPDALVGKRGYELVHPDDRVKVRDLIAELFETGQVADRDRIYRVPDAHGQYVWMEGNPSLVRNADGGVEAVISQLRDVSARKALEEELRAARDEAQAAAATKAEFMANMSHEIRTPLTAILGFTSLIGGRDGLDDQTAYQVGRISAAGQALLSIVNDILDFSKLEAGLMPISARPCPARQALADAVALLEPQAQAKGLALAFAPAQDLPDHLLLDPDRMRQVLLNLIGNAVKFTDAGDVTVTADYNAARERLTVAVRDSGAGMDAEQQARLFQRFSQVDGAQAKAGRGTGLGLAISRGLVEAMGGEIGLTSTPGEGSVFRFQVPAPVCAAPAAALAALAPAGIAGLRVLLADDNAANREIAKSVLEPFEVEVTDVTDGAEAVELAALLPYDVILLDIRMPGMDGPAAARRIRSEPGPNRDAPILAFSANHELGPEAAGLFDGHVLKPIEVGALLAALAQATAWEDALAETG